MDGIVIDGKVGMMVNHGKVDHGKVMVVIKDVVVGMMIKDIVAVTLSTPSTTPLFGAIITKCKRRRGRDKLIYGIMIVVINSAMGGPQPRNVCQHTECQ